MSDPKVSVAILNVGLRERIERLLRLLAVRPVPAIHEVLGIGDPAPFPGNMRRVPVETGSIARAKNVAFEETSGDFVLLLAGDTVAPPATVETLARILEEHPRCALVSARLLLESGRPRAWEGRFPRLGRELALSTALWLRWRRIRYLPRGRVESPSYPVEWTPCLCALVRRKAFERIGPWPEGYRFDFDDAAWCRRARDLGWEARRARQADAFQLAPYRYMEECPREVVQGFEESLVRLIEETKPARSASLHCLARRTRLRLARACSLLESFLLLRRHYPTNYTCESTRWLLDWYASGRPHVDLPPTVERECYWFGLT